jgi:hypothetical protein
VDPVLGVVVAEHLLLLEHGVQRGEALLPINDEQVSCLLLGVDPDPAAFARECLPEEQVPDREPLVHGVEEVTNARRLPDERPLDVRKAQRSQLDVA